MLPKIKTLPILMSNINNTLVTGSVLQKHCSHKRTLDFKWLEQFEYFFIVVCISWPEFDHSGGICYKGRTIKSKDRTSIVNCFDTLFQK